MAWRIRNHGELGAGLLYLAVGAVILFVGNAYTMGAAARMGPGYFPRIVGLLLLFMGVGALARALLRGGDALEAIAWRPLLLTPLAVLVFALALQPLGLLLASLLLIAIGSLASRSFEYDRATLLWLGLLVVLSAVVFVLGLGLPLPLLGAWFTR